MAGALGKKHKERSKDRNILVQYTYTALGVCGDRQTVDPRDMVYGGGFEGYLWLFRGWRCGVCRKYTWCDCVVRRDEQGVSFVRNHPFLRTRKNASHTHNIPTTTRRDQSASTPLTIYPSQSKEKKDKITSLV